MNTKVDVSKQETIVVPFFFSPRLEKRTSGDRQLSKLHHFKTKFARKKQIVEDHIAQQNVLEPIMLKQGFVNFLDSLILFFEKHKIQNNNEDFLRSLFFAKEFYKTHLIQTKDEDGNLKKLDLITNKEYFTEIGVFKIFEKFNEVFNMAEIQSKYHVLEKSLDNLIERYIDGIQNPSEYFENLNFQVATSFDLFVMLMSQTNKENIFGYFVDLEHHANTTRNFDKCFEIKKSKFEGNAENLIFMSNKEERIYTYIYLNEKIVIKYNKIHLNAHEQISPGWTYFNSLYEKIVDPSTKSLEFKQIYKNEEVGIINVSSKYSKQQALMKKLEIKYDLEEGAILQFLSDYTCGLLKHNDGSLSLCTSYESLIQNTYNKYEVKSSLLIEPKLDLRYGHPDITLPTMTYFEFSSLPMSKIPNFLSSVPFEISTMRWERKGMREFELIFRSFINDGTIVPEWFDLYCSLVYEEAIVVMPYYSNEERKFVEFKDNAEFGEHEKFCIDKPIFNENAYYPVIELKDYENFETQDLFTNIHTRGKFLLEKLKVKNLSKVEKMELTGYYSYLNKTARDKSNIRIFEVIEVYESDRAKFSDIMEILCLRLGDCANLVNSLIMFRFNIDLSLTAWKEFKHLPIYYLKHEYWISFWKQVSDQVKNYYCLGSSLLNMKDWRCLQYIEMFYGQFGGHEITAYEAISSRNYIHNPKSVFCRSSEGDAWMLEEKQLRQLIIGLFVAYWDKVFQKTRSTSGLKRNIELRSKWSTSASASGGKNAFSPEFMKKVFGNSIKTAGGTKAAVFSSENNEFFTNAIADIPMTLSNMTLKPKEFAKHRYIYGVSINHYIINSLLTYDFEKHFDHFGIEMFQNNIKGFNETIKPSKKDVFNCLDYSEFNDQHEEMFRTCMWEAFIKSINNSNVKYKDDYILLAKWMKTACQTIWLKIPYNERNLYRHKGRLLSGERATSLTNSLCSMVYLALGYWNYFSYHGKIQYDTESLKHMIRNPMKLHGLKELLNNNRILGDDNRLAMDTIYEGALLNKMLRFTGFIIKPSKCLLGYKISEFLRLVNTHNTGKNSHEGYPNRAIISSVAGNLEGKSDRHVYAAVNELYMSLNTVFIRTKNVGILNDVLYKVKDRLTKLKKDYKGKMSISTNALPDFYLHVNKKQGGFGFIKFGQSWTYKLNRTIILPKREVVSKNVNNAPLKDKNLFQAPEELNRSNVLAMVGKYGNINGQKFEQEMNVQKRTILESLHPDKVIYSVEWLLEYKGIIDSLWDKKLIVEEMDVKNLTEYNLKEIDTQRVKQFLGSKMLSSNVGSSMAKKVEGIKIVLKLVDLNCSENKYIKSKFGEKLATYYNIKETLMFPNYLNFKFDSGQFNNLLTEVLFELKLYNNPEGVVKVIYEHFKSENDSKM